MDANTYLVSCSHVRPADGRMVLDSRGICYTCRPQSCGTCHAPPGEAHRYVRKTGTVAGQTVRIAFPCPVGKAAQEPQASYRC